MRHDHIICDDMEEAKPLTEETWRKWLKDIFYMVPERKYPYITGGFEVPISPYIEVEKGCYPGKRIHGEIKPSPLPESMFGRDHAKEVENILRGGYPGAILGEWTWFDGLRAFVYKILQYFTRRPKMFGKRKKREIKNLVEVEFDRLIREHNENKHEKIDAALVTYRVNYTNTDLWTVLTKILQHLGMALEHTAEKTELVSITKKKKRSRKPVSKPKKKGG